MLFVYMCAEWDKSRSLWRLYSSDSPEVTLSWEHDIEGADVVVTSGKPVSYKRVNKKVARRLFAEGVTVRVLPCKANPHSPWWHGGACWNPAYIKENTSKDFDEMVSAFIYYNCNYETGYYPAFYIKED